MSPRSSRAGLPYAGTGSATTPPPLLKRSGSCHETQRQKEIRFLRALALMRRLSQSITPHGLKDLSNAQII